MEKRRFRSCTWKGVSKRYGGVRALEKAELDVTAAESMPFSARTALANRHSSRSWPALLPPMKGA